MSEKLIKAIQYRNIESIEKLLEAGVDVSFTDEDPMFKDWTPLHHAVRIGGFYPMEGKKMAEMFIRKGADIEAVTFEGNTPVLLSIKYFALEILDVLIMNGGTINSVNSKNKNAFDIIIDRYYDDQQLEEDHIEEELNKERKAAIKKGEGEALERMLTRIDAITKHEYDLNSGKYSAARGIILLISKHNMPSKVLEYVFNKGANPDEYVLKNNVQLPLLDLVLACKLPPEISEIIIKRIGVNHIFDKYHKTSPLHLAASRNDIALAKKLISKGANMSIIDNLGNIPLSYAEKKKFKKMINLLKG